MGTKVGSEFYHMSIFLSLCVWVSLYADVIVLLFSLSFFSSYFFFVLHICSVRVRIQPVRDEESGSGVISSAQVSGVFLFCEKGLKRESGRKRKKGRKIMILLDSLKTTLKEKKKQFCRRLCWFCMRSLCLSASLGVLFLLSWGAILVDWHPCSCEKIPLAVERRRYSDRRLCTIDATATHKVATSSCCCCMN